MVLASSGSFLTCETTKNATDTHLTCHGGETLLLVFSNTFQEWAVKHKSALFSIYIIQLIVFTQGLCSSRNWLTIGMLRSGRKVGLTRWNHQPGASLLLSHPVTSHQEHLTLTNPWTKSSLRVTYIFKSSKLSAHCYVTPKRHKLIINSEAGIWEIQANDWG